MEHSCGTVGAIKLNRKHHKEIMASCSLQFNLYNAPDRVVCRSLCIISGENYCGL